MTRAESLYGTRPDVKNPLSLIQTPLQEVKRINYLSLSIVKYF